MTAHAADAAAALIGCLCLIWWGAETWARRKAARKPDPSDVEIARLRHPATEISIVPLTCSDCGGTYYQLPTTGDDRDKVIAAAKNDWVPALNWHRTLEHAR